MCLCAIIKIDCECSALLIIVNTRVPCSGLQKPKPSNNLVLLCTTLLVS